MAFSHTNSIRYKYTAGGVEADKTIAKTESGSAEINIEHEVTMGATVTADLSVPGFEFADASQAVSIYARLDGVNGAIYCDASSGGDKIADLDDGEPFVWSKNGGLNFPAGATNTLVDSTTSLVVKPDAYHATTNPLAVDGNKATITLRVLYDGGAA